VILLRQPLPFTRRTRRAAAHIHGGLAARLKITPRSATGLLREMQAGGVAREVGREKVRRTFAL